MTDEKDELSGSDWLSNQFTPTEQVPAQPAATPPPADGDSAFDWLLQDGQAGAAAAPPAQQQVLAAPAFVPPPLVAPPEPFVAPPTEPYSPFGGEPTRPLSWDEFAATQQPATQSPQPTSQTPAPTPTFVDEPTQAFTVPPWEPAAAHPVYPAASAAPASSQPDGEPTSALDSLFGDHQFQAYEEVGVLASVQSVPGLENAEPKPPREPLSTMQKTLMTVAGGLIAVLILIAMYFLGQHIGASQAAAAAAAAAKTSSTTAPKSASTGGPASPGVQPWTALQGGECLNPFTSAWAATFTVVPCSSDHVAEMVFKGTLPDAAGSGYPTTAQFQTEVTGLCSAPTAINYALAKSITDLQVSFSYPPTTSKWLAGDRTYYCFVDRQSGGNLQGDLAVPASGN